MPLWPRASTTASSQLLVPERGWQRVANAELEGLEHVRLPLQVLPQEPRGAAARGEPEGMEGERAACHQEERDDPDDVLPP